MGTLDIEGTNIRENSPLFPSLLITEAISILDVPMGYNF
jgi:hypothetical protein